MSPDSTVRGTTISYEHLYPLRKELPAQIEERFENGAEAEAFYLLEVDKARSLLGWRLLVEQARTNPDMKKALANVGDAGRQAVAGEAKEGTRGVKLGKVSTAYLTSLDSFTTLRDEAFWREQKRVADLNTAAEQGSVSAWKDTTSRWTLTSVERLQWAMIPGEALLTIFVGERNVWAQLVTTDGRFSHNAGPPVALKAAAATLLDAAKDPGSKNAWREPGRKVYEALIAPFATQLEAAGVRSLVIAPHDFTANIPFAALPTAESDPKLLIDRFVVSYVPSANHYRQGHSRPLTTHKPVGLVVGNPEYPAPWSPLPKAEAEARTLAYVFEDRALLTGAEATESRFYDLHGGFNVLHFATHGLLGTGTDLPAASLVLTADGHNDGYLTALEIQRLDLSHSQLVVLSACETSLSDERRDDANIASLTGAFLAAGAPTVVGSQWHVSDDATALLMLDFYRQYLELGTGQALRHAQLAIRRQANYQHPFFWAAFVLYGWNG